MSYAQFCSDPLRRGVTTYDVSYVDPTDGSTGTLRFSSRRYATGPNDTPASKRYDARVLENYNYTGSSGDLVEGGIPTLAGLLPAREGGSFVVAQKHGDLDWLRTMSFDNQPLIIRYGGRSKYGILPFEDFQQVFYGVCAGQPIIQTDKVTFKLRNRDSLLFTPLTEKRYHGGEWCLHADDSGTPEISLTNNAAFNFLAGDPFSWTFWYRPQRAGDPGDPYTAQEIFSRGTSGAYGWQIFQTKDDRISLTTSNTGAMYTYSTPITINEWVHVAVCYDGAASCVIYLDGVNSVASTAGTHAGCATATLPLYVFRNQTGIYRATCMIDEIRCYKRVLTQDEILAGMFRHLAPSEETDADLIGYWNCEDGTGTTIADRSVTNADGTLTDVDWVPSLQGGSELEGQVILDAWGEKPGMAPTLVHRATNIYQVHSAQIEEILSVKEGLNPISVDGADITDLVTFLLDTTEPNMYQVLNCAQGSYIRLRRRPTLPVSVALKGDKSDGTYRSNPVEQVRYIVCTRGLMPLVDVDDIDDAGFDAAATATAGVVTGHVTYEETTVGELVGRLLAGTGVSVWFKRNGGRFTALKYTGAASGTPVINLTDSDVKIGSLESLDAGSPIYRVSIDWGLNDVVHKVPDVAGAIQGTEGQNFGMKQWRTASVPNWKVLSDYPGAGTVYIESAMTNMVDAWAASVRLQTLNGTVPQAFRCMFRHRSVDLDRFDCFSFQFGDKTKRGARQARFGMSLPGGTPTQFTVLNVEDAPDEGGTWVTFVREDNSVDAAPAEEEEPPV